ncbi:MAG: alpha/beta hydrolase [Pseudomonadota bacterium]
MPAMILAVALAAAPLSAPPAYHIGETTRTVHPDGPRNWRGAAEPVLPTRIWYPVDAALQGHRHDIGPPDVPFFRTHPMVTDAPFAPTQTRYPLIVLSHGTGGSADTMEWLGSALAAAGYIVAGVDHPGNSAMGPETWDGFSLWWERATDVTQMLDALLADPIIGPHIDSDRIGAAGFSLGGYTVLALAGALTNLSAFLAFCRSPKADEICNPPEMARVIDNPADGTAPSPERAASLARSGASYRDPRIRAVFGISPAVGKAFDERSFANVTVPIWLMAGDADVYVPPATNLRHIARLYPAAKVTMVPGAGHYTFIQTCEPAAVERLGLICKDGPGIDRDAVHDLAAKAAVQFFSETLQTR